MIYSNDEYIFMIHSRSTDFKLILYILFCKYDVYI
jgi:hypothetical protein